MNSITATKAPIPDESSRQDHLARAEESRARRWKGRSRGVAGLAAALAVLVVLMRPIFHIRFGIIDDHEIADIVGRHDRLPVDAILPTIIDRSAEQVARFRPVYWVGRTLESAVAGRNVDLWHVDRVLLAALVLSCVYFIAVRYTHPLLAALIALLPFSGPQFETWNRLGPAETYATPLLCLAALMLVRAIERHASPSGMWAGYALVTAAALAKENFVLVAIPVIVWTAMVSPKRMVRRDWLVVSGFLTINLAHVAILATLQHRFGSLYPQPRTFDSFLRFAEFAVEAADRHAGLGAALLAFALLGSSVRRPRSTYRALGNLGALVAVIVGLQLGFYAGAPQEGRYLYPILFGCVFLWMVVGSFVNTIDSRFRRTLALGAIAISLVGPMSAGLTNAWESTAEATDRTVAFEESFHQMRHIADRGGVSVVVLQPADPRTDYERVLSVARYLRAWADLRVMTLAPTTIADDPFSRQLEREMRTWTNEGHDVLEPYERPADCLSVVFGPNEPVCLLAVTSTS